MKKTFLAGFALALCALLTGACSSSNDDDGGDDIIWDFAPIVLQIQITDAAGHDMLDPLNNSNLLGRISVTYKGVTYGPMKEVEDVYGSGSRAYAPFFYGLLLGQWYDQEWQRQGYYLEFGEFDGAKNGEEEMTLSLEPMVFNGLEEEGAGEVVTQTFRLSFTNQLTWKSKREPVVSRHFFLDGAEHGGPTYRFIYDTDLISQRLTPKD